MAGKKEEVGQLGTDELTKTPEPEPELKTYTQEEYDALQVQIKEEELAKYQGLQRVVSQKDQKIKELEARAIQPPTTFRGGSKVGELLLQEMRARQTEYGEPNPRIAELEAEIAKERQQELAEQQAQYRQLKETIDGYRKRTENIGLTEDDEEYWEIHDLVTEQKFKRADIKLKKLEEAKVKPEPKSKETEDERIERLAEEKLRAKMEEKGLLSSEPSGPSAGSERTFTAEQIADRKFYEEHREAILKAYAEGKIK